LARFPSTTACVGQVEVGPVLPVPASDTPLERVLRFRDDYQDERTRLRMALHRLFEELEGVGGPDEVPAAGRLEIADALRDMEAACVAGSWSGSGGGCGWNDSFIWSRMMAWLGLALLSPR
jgi:hypothetical protein